jgi:hypothetical protein
MTHAAQNLHAVALNLHAPPAPVAPLTPFQLAIDLLHINRQTGRQAFDDRHKRATV